ncbi:hypothetical protein [Chryseobacterium luteum]|uniref:Uncharacterized protein n=1 Tax=Chryseobacterium luteum TaxID=421531 RepID=A0A085ZHE5_9FLAO|nr:hypothetical protein [Chryseobacterium luteum]KFF03859.1 hypothetical protein IX38_10650 [Chryseobacterium luteum]
MIKTEKLNNSILAIQDLIIRARSLAYQNVSMEILAEFLDGLEYLPALILEQDDRTDLFESFLEELCTKYSFLEVLDKYKKI